jgi:hypothetical protein
MALILSGDTGVPASGMPTGSVIQTVTVNISSPSNTTSQMNYSSALPTISQGTQACSITFTPIVATSVLYFWFNEYATSSAVSNIIFALFEGNTCISAIAPRYVTNTESGWANVIQMSKAANGTQTYSVRYGPQNPGTASLNTYPQYTGVPQGAFTIQEIKA